MCMNDKLIAERQEIVLEKIVRIDNQQDFLIFLAILSKIALTNFI